MENGGKSNKGGEASLASNSCYVVHSDSGKTEGGVYWISALVQLFTVPSDDCNRKDTAAGLGWSRRAAGTIVEGGKSIDMA